VIFSQGRIARCRKFRSLSLSVLEQRRQKSVHKQVFLLCVGLFSPSYVYCMDIFSNIYVYFWHVQVSFHVQSSVLWVSVIHITSVFLYTCVELFQSFTCTSFNVPFFPHTYVSVTGLLLWVCRSLFTYVSFHKIELLRASIFTYISSCVFHTCKKFRVFFIHTIYLCTSICVYVYLFAHTCLFTYISFHIRFFANTSLCTCIYVHIQLLTPAKMQKKKSFSLSLLYIDLVCGKKLAR